MASADWEAIESAYRAGVMSLREIASQHGISDTAIRKRAKKDGWSQDLAAKIQAKADDLVRRREVRAKVRIENATSERELVEATAEVIATVRMEHRGDSVSAPLIATNLDSVTSSVATVVNFSYAAGATNAPDAAGGTGRQYIVGTVISQLVVSDNANAWRRSKTGSAAWSAWVKTGFNDNDLTANPWGNLSLQNGWTVQSGTRAAYRKLFGKLDVDLHITGGSFSNGVILATLPTGSRPAVTQSALLIASGTWNNSYPPRMFIGSDGNISMWGLINNGQLDAAVTINL